MVDVTLENLAVDARDDESWTPAPVTDLDLARYARLPLLTSESQLPCGKGGNDPKAVEFRVEGSVTLTQDCELAAMSKLTLVGTKPQASIASSSGTTRRLSVAEPSGDVRIAGLKFDHVALSLSVSDGAHADWRLAANHFVGVGCDGDGWLFSADPVRTAVPPRLSGEAHDFEVLAVEVTDGATLTGLTLDGNKIERACVTGHGIHVTTGGSPIHVNSFAAPDLGEVHGNGRITGLTIRGNLLSRLYTDESEALAVVGNVDGALIAENRLEYLTNIGIDLIGYEASGNDAALPIFTGKLENAVVTGNWVRRYVPWSNTSEGAAIYADSVGRVAFVDNHVHHYYTGIECHAETELAVALGPTLLLNNAVSSTAGPWLKIAQEDCTNGWDPDATKRRYPGRAKIARVFVDGTNPDLKSPLTLAPNQCGDAQPCLSVNQWPPIGEVRGASAEVNVVHGVTACAGGDLPSWTIAGPSPNGAPAAKTVAIPEACGSAKLRTGVDARACIDALLTAFP